MIGKIKAKYLKNKEVRRRLKEINLIELKNFFYHNVKFGDMVLTTKVRWDNVSLIKEIVYKVVYFFITLVSRSQYVHVVMAIGKNKFISFEPPRARIIDLDDFIHKKILVRRRYFRWTIKQKNIVMNIWKNEYEGTYYDIFQLVNMLFHWFFRIPRNKYLLNLFPKNKVCSVGFCELERRTGINTFGKINTDRVNPGDCRRNKYYNDIIFAVNGKLKKVFVDNLNINFIGKKKENIYKGV